MSHRANKCSWTDMTLISELEISQNIHRWKYSSLKKVTMNRFPGEVLWSLRSYSCVREPRSRLDFMCSAVWCEYEYKLDGRMIFTLFCCYSSDFHRLSSFGGDEGGVSQFCGRKWQPMLRPPVAQAPPTCPRADWHFLCLAVEMQPEGFIFLFCGCRGVRCSVLFTCWTEKQHWLVSEWEQTADLYCDH